MRALKAAWGEVVRLLGDRERATSIACLRILFGACVLVDGAAMAFFDLPPVLWGPRATHGLGTMAELDPPWLLRMVGPWGLLELYLAGGASLLLGVLPRLGAALFVLSSAEMARLHGLGDRGIDVLLRIVGVLLLFVRSGATLSLPTRLRTGRFTSDALVPAWPRYLVVLQLLWCYFSAGHNKSGTPWWPWGGFEAVWNVLHDPHFSAVHVGEGWLVYRASQLLSAGTLLFEWSAPLMLIALYDRRRPANPGRLRRFLRRVRFWKLWAAAGVAFHLGLAATLRLGIFPYAMLALYPAFLRPADVEAAFARLRGRAGTAAGATATR